MTAAEQQVALANAFGVLPSRQSAADAYLAKLMGMIGLKK